MNDPIWLMLVKVILVVVILLTWTIFNVWFERRLVGKMQQRLGPILNGPLGLGQALADGMKCLFKEDFIPSMVDRVLFVVSPLIAGTAAFTAWAVIPFGGEVEIFGITTRLQVTDLPVGVLVLLAVTSVAIYGFVLAGWSSNSPYSLLGGLRSSAQMISYEIAMGLALVSVFLYTGSMSTYQIVEAQRAGVAPFGLNLGLQNWNWLVLLPSFVIYVIAMVGETNRAPFDLPEAESELVSGYITEYSGFKYAIYFLAEYINMATVSAIATTLFMGGYLPIWPFNLIEPLNNPWLGPIWFIIKVQLFIAFFVWIRGTLPRFRYDQFMTLGWKGLIPVALIWTVVFATFQWLRSYPPMASGPGIYLMIGLLALVVFGVVMAVDRPEPELTEAPAGVVDVFAGGYPVPPLPGQVLPELSAVVASTAEPAEPAAERNE
jgi:NADH-quinone oxidoreductase subunit H